MLAVASLVASGKLGFAPVEWLGGEGHERTCNKSSGVMLLSDLNHGPEALKSYPNGLRIRKVLPRQT